jgi:hypothetical protein
VFNRDSIMFLLLLVVAVVGYLITAQKPPTDWGYMEWLQACSFVLAWVVGKLSGSPLAGNSTPVSRQEPALGGLVSITKEPSK